MKLFIRVWVALAVVLVLGSCSTYFKSYEALEGQLQLGNYQKASKILDGDKNLNKNRNQLLYYFNKGYILHVVGEYDSSNYYFNQADYMIEDYKVNIGSEIGSLFFNPTITPYRAENFEGLMIHYYKSLNYMYLKKYESALVEARRLNLKLQELDDKYPDNKNKYQNDPFSHILMGLIYDAQKDYNNAFIAYRNAVNIFDASDRGSFLGIQMPEQLKKDIIRVAIYSGFGSDAELYSRKFNIPLSDFGKNDGGDLVLFWENGRGPYKTSTFIAFMILGGEVGWVRFVNNEFNINFPFYVGNLSKDEQKGLLDMKIFRMAIPKYTERRSIYRDAKLVSDNQTFQLQVIQDINSIALKSLRDRLMVELSKSVLRMAVKKSTEIALRKQNEQIGNLLGIANALTENADTRGWFTLPNTISYTRIPLDSGSNNLALKLYSNRGEKTVDLSFNGDGNTHFFNYKTIGWTY
jgi:hypothetical protein